MQISKPFVKTAIFIFVLFCSVTFINFLLVPYSSMMKRFRGYRTFMENQKNIDFLVIGSSQEFDGFDQNTINSELDLNSYVFCVQGGIPETSYYILKDVISKNSPKTVLVGWDTIGNFEVPHSPYPSNRRAQMYRELLVDSKNNKPLLFTTLKNLLDQRYTMTFFEYAAFPENITEIKNSIESRKLLKEKWTQTETTSSNPMKYDGKNPNALKNYDEITSKKYGNEVYFEDKDFTLKLKKLCNDNNIDLYFVIGPYPEIIHENLEVYDKLVQQSRQFFEENDLNYIDSNSSYFEGLSKNENFHDCAGHLVMNSKIEYTRKICNFLKENSSN